MRAALLPTPGDPFVLAYWLRNFETWREYVDELVVFVNGSLTPEQVEYDRTIIEAAGGRMLYAPFMVGHDGALLRLLQETDAKYVVLCEDDAYVRHPEAVAKAFRDVRTGETDIVGSPRHEDYSGQYVDFGSYRWANAEELRHGLWPAFLFARRADLLATDRRFGDRRWDIGDVIEGWGRVSPEACAFVGVAPNYVHLDTFFGTTFQLRAAGLSVRLVHHVRLFDAKATEEWLAEDPPWFHVTGVSTLGDALGRDPTTLPDMGPTGGLWTRRVAWWLTVTEGQGAHRRLEALERFIAWSDRFDPWVNWVDVPMQVLRTFTVPA